MHTTWAVDCPVLRISFSVTGPCLTARLINISHAYAEKSLLLWAVKIGMGYVSGICPKLTPMAIVSNSKSPVKLTTCKEGLPVNYRHKCIRARRARNTQMWNRWNMRIKTIKQSNRTVLRKSIRIHPDSTQEVYQNPTRLYIESLSESNPTVHWKSIMYSAFPV